MISELQITIVKPNKGLVAFASLVLNNSLYIGAMGVYKRLDGEGYRITYPTKNIGNKQLNIYYPINKELGRLIEHVVTVECHKLFARSDY